MSETALSKSIRDALCGFCGATLTSRKAKSFCSIRCANTARNKTTSMRARSSERAALRNRASAKHGEATELTAEYTAWRSMKRRCSPNNAKSRAYYSDRGIRVCPEWEASFSSFLAHVGRRPTPQHSIDRINNNGNYEPGNVRWATWSEQMRNRRCSRK